MGNLTGDGFVMLMKLRLVTHFADGLDFHAVARHLLAISAMKTIMQMGTK
jgi:hypothetical protein